MRRPLMPLLPLAVAACAHVPSGNAPTVQVPAAFRNLGANGDAEAKPGWWRSFADPTLDSLVSEALAGGLSIEAAAARLEAASAGARAASAARLPLLTGSASVQRQSATLEDPIGRFASRVPGFERTNTLYGLNLAASWEVDLFGRLAAGERAARADASAAAADLAGARLTTAAEVVTAYIGARELQARLAIAQRRARILGDLEGLVSRRYAKGAAARVEMDQVQADLGSAQSAVPALRMALEATYNRIDVLSGRAPGQAERTLATGEVPRAPVVAAGESPAALLLARPDVVAAERRVAAADARVAQALADRLPRLSLSALFGVLSAGLSNLLTGDAAQSSVGAGLTGPLLDLGRSRAGVDAARARTREAVAQYRLAALSAVAEVEDASAALSRRREQAEILGRTVAARSRASDALRLSYTAGASSLIEALDAERLLLGAQDAEVVARADAARSSVAAFRVLGGGALAATGAAAGSGR